MNDSDPKVTVMLIPAQAACTKLSVAGVAGDVTSFAVQTLVVDSPVALAKLMLVK